MKKFMDADFLLQTKTAQTLFHEYAENQPIFDYHCHLNPQEIADNIRFDNISTVWLGTRTFGDHYKWRQMRTNGFTEQVDDPWVKFESWAKTLENLFGNPLYHWTHLELQRYFGITEPLCGENARKIYDQCNRILAEDPDFNVFGIFKKFNVYAVGTTDDPADTLEYHFAAKGKSPAKVLPSYRPDKAMNIDAEGFAEYICKLGKAAQMDISSAEDVLKALEKRLDFFIEAGCRASDHALVDAPYAPAPVSKVNEIFTKVMNGEKISAEEAEMYRFFIMTGLGRAYAKRGVAMQLHFASIRNNNSAKFKLLGA
ncbi:MAG: glucuronate isomerase, partial [Sphaerochaetaceae bacterium]|nr:glucuronate isomerase [Sphaerochaetaceae bacterium]